MAKTKLPKTKNELLALQKKTQLKLDAFERQESVLDKELDKVYKKQDKLFEKMYPVQVLMFAISDKLFDLVEKATEVK